MRGRGAAVGIHRAICTCNALPVEIPDMPRSPVRGCRVQNSSRWQKPDYSNLLRRSPNNLIQPPQPPSRPPLQAAPAQSAKPSGSTPPEVRARLLCAGDQRNRSIDKCYGNAASPILDPVIGPREERPAPESTRTGETQIPAAARAAGL